MMLWFLQIANHPLLVRRIYTDDDVVRIARVVHPKGVFGFECTVDRVIEELKSYNDFSIHKVYFLLFHSFFFLRTHLLACIRLIIASSALPHFNLFVIV